MLSDAIVRVLPEALLDSNAPADLLLSTEDLSQLTGMSKACLTNRRVSGDGPPFIQIGPTLVRYRYGDVRAWIAKLTYTSVRAAEADGRKIGGGPGKGKVGVVIPRVLARRAAAAAAASAAQAES